jgi:hypothetical protein
VTSWKGRAAHNVAALFSFLKDDFEIIMSEANKSSREVLL